MSIPQTNFENNNRMSELTKNINDIFGYILLYTVIIFTTLSALLGGIVVYPIYKIIKVFNKIREHCCKSASRTDVNLENEVASEVEKPDKKPIIDENWCNVSVKNIINYTNEVASEAEENEIETEEVASEAEENEADASEAASEAAEENEADVANEEAVVNEEVASEAEENLAEEVLSVRRPSEEELRQFQKEEDENKSESSEVDDYSPKDKYSIGHYKSNTCINDPLDFDN